MCSHVLHSWIVFFVSPAVVHCGKRLLKFMAAWKGGPLTANCFSIYVSTCQYDEEKVGLERCEPTSSKFSACSGFRLAPAGPKDIFAELVKSLENSEEAVGIFHEGCRTRCVTRCVPYRKCCLIRSLFPGSSHWRYRYQMAMRQASTSNLMLDISWHPLQGRSASL